MNSWLEPVDNYCERVGTHLLAEPINAISNVAFLIAAYAAFMHGCKHQSHTNGSYWLVFWLALIGIGSTLFHTFANRWSAAADVLPIYLYQFSIIGLYGAAIGRHRQSSPSIYSAMVLILFILTVLLFSLLPRDLLNGSVGYFPALVFTLAIGIYHYQFFTVQRYALLLAALLLILSLTFRSIDLALCNLWPIGTHFLWHLLNGAVLYLTLIAYLSIQQAKLEKNNL